MSITWRLLVAIGFFALAAPAQDFVRLHDGERIRGEIRQDDDKTVGLIDLLGRYREFPRTEIKSVKKGRVLHPKIVARLKALDESSSDSLFALVKWAQEQGKFKREIGVLSRRVLFLDPDHLQARKILKHVQAFGVWYQNDSTRRRALKKIMKAKGLIPHGRGWLDPLQLDLVKASAGDWAVDPESFRWRLLREIREDQGMTEWLGQWYEFAEGRVLEEMAVIKRQLNVDCHGAQVGNVVVYGPINRKLAQEHIKEILKARDWFVATFRPKQASAIAAKPASFTIFRTLPNAQAFIDKGAGKFHTAGKDFAAFCRDSGFLPFNSYSLMTHQERTTWRHDDVARVGIGLMDSEWSGRRGCPDWISIASAHHAEFAVYGKMKTVWVALSKYDRQEKVRETRGETIVAAKERLLEHYRRHRTTTVRQLFSRRTNQMTPADDAMGIVLMSYLLEKHRANWLKFLFGSTEQKLEERARQKLGMDFPKLEENFRAWLGIK